MQEKWRRKGDNSLNRTKTSQEALSYDSNKNLSPEKQFSYPVHFATEDYHVIDEHNQEKATLRFVPNRIIKDQIDSFKSRNSPDKQTIPFGRKESRHLIPKLAANRKKTEQHAE